MGLKFDVVFFFIFIKIVSCACFFYIYFVCFDWIDEVLKKIVSCAYSWYICDTINRLYMNICDVCDLGWYNFEFCIHVSWNNTCVTLIEINMVKDYICLRVAAKLDHILGENACI